MRDWIEAQLRGGLPAFAGTQISGTIAVKQELINELLKAWLAATASGGPGTPTLDVSQSLRAIKAASVRAEPGAVLVDFEVAI
jgi:hypothetical protein